MRLLNGYIVGLGTVSQALDEVNARYGREALQLVQRELGRAVHHAVKQQTILLGIDIRHDRAAVGAHEMERRRRDAAYGVLKRRQDVKGHPEGIGPRSVGHGYAHRGHERRALAIGDQVFGVLSWLRFGSCGRLSGGGAYSAYRRAYGQAGDCGATF